MEGLKMFRMFKDMKLGAKIGGGFAVVILLFVGAISTYHWVNTSFTENFNDLLHNEKAIADNSARVESLMLQCRRNEKDFLLRKDKKYSQKLEKNIELLNQETSAIELLAKKNRQ